MIYNMFQESPDISLPPVCKKYGRNIYYYLFIMCIVIIKRSLNPDYSFFIGMNRDEKYSKHWDEINSHWVSYPDIIGYRDHDSGGTWFGYNGDLTAILINRESIYFENLRSRSKIVLKTLQNAKNIFAAINNILDEDTKYYKPFNLVILDNKDIVLATNYYDNDVNSRVNVTHIIDDLTLINRSFPNDLHEKRIKMNIEKFQRVKEPNPKDNYWDDWEKLLTTECYAEVPEDETCLWLNSKEWGTLMSEIIAIPRKTNQMPIKHRVKTRC